MQLTLRVDAALAVGLKCAATERGQSVNAFATAVLRAAIDPDLAGAEAEKVRERLLRAGLLAASQPGPRSAIDPQALGDARRAAGRGTPVADLVGEERR